MVVEVGGDVVLIKVQRQVEFLKSRGKLIIVRDFYFNGLPLVFNLSSFFY